MENKQLFRHIRIVDQEELIYLINNNVAPTNIRDIPQKKAGTICITYNEKEFRIGISICSDKDNFNRKIGRQISSTRSNEMPLIRIPITEELDADQQYHVAVSFLNKFEQIISSNFIGFKRNLVSIKTIIDE